MNSKELDGLASELMPNETAILINSLAPFRKKQFLQSLNVEKRLEIARSSQADMLISDMKRDELSLSTKIEKILIGKTGQETQQKKVNLSYLTDTILKAGTFSDDESFYRGAEKSGQRPVAFLNLLDESREEFWGQLDLMDLAYASFGYSEEVLGVFQGRLSEKRKYWFKDFLARVRDERQEFLSPESVKARTRILEQIKRKPNDESENESKAA